MTGLTSASRSTPTGKSSLLITSGNGPGECEQAVAGILERIREEADATGVELDLSATPGKHGIRSAVLILYGPGSAGFARRWIGTIRWRAKSNLRPHHKRANWFIGIFELPPARTGSIRIDPQDVSYESFRAGGPGGQHQNTTDSAVRAIHRPTGMVAVAREMRSQHRNKALALERLIVLASMQAQAEAEARKGDRNLLHHALERGNPIRSFKGARFREEPV